VKADHKLTNIPAPGEVNLDHTGHFISDTTLASQILGDAGFTVTPFSAQVQPDPDTGTMKLTGTGNICVMLRQGYLEFLAQTADTLLGREFKAALERRAGLHLVAFGTADSAARHAELSAAGHPMRPLVRMSRDIGTQDGSAKARFVVARLADNAMPEGRVQMVTHRDESALWQPGWLDHPNGVQALSAMVLSTPDPAKTAARFAAFLDRPAHGRADGGFVIGLDRGALEILPQDAAIALVGQPVEPERSAFAACRLMVADIDATEAFFGKRGATFSRDADRLILPFPAPLGIGAWIFEQSA